MANLSLAQNQTKAAPAKPVEETPLQRVWKEFQSAAKESKGDPQKEISILAQYVKEHAADIHGNSVAANFGFTMADLLPKMKSDPHAMLASLKTMNKAMAAVSPFDRAQYDAILAARGILQQKILLPEGAKLARQSVDLMKESDYIANAREENQQTNDYHRTHDKNFTPEAFSLSDAQAHFAGEKASRLATLGSLDVLLCKFDEAAAAFQESIDLHPVTGAYVGLSRIEEDKGDKSKALELLAKGYLAGRMSAENIDHLRKLFGDTHQKEGDKGLQEYLDKLYAPTFHNPITPQPYQANSSDTGHTVLAELFTGAGCEPCMSPDLSFDAALQRYSRKQMVLVVYHNNAPDNDPLTNFAGEERGHFYGTQLSTPHVLIDGKEVMIGEGLPDHAQAAYDKLTALLDKALKQPSGGELHISAKLVGQQVHVQVTGNASTLKGAAHLQIVLLEKDVHYSGANTLRFQPMVERAMADLGKDSSGIPMASDGSIHAEYVFDLDQIAGANMRYYDHDLAWLRSRVPWYVDFPEERPEVNPDDLAVAAFVQQDSDKRIEQSSYFALPAPVAMPAVTKAETKPHD